MRMRPSFGGSGYIINIKYSLQRKWEACLLINHGEVAARINMLWNFNNSWMSS